MIFSPLTTFRLEPARLEPALVRARAQVPALNDRIVHRDYRMIHKD
jgi:hypothetical protein